MARDYNFDFKGVGQADFTNTNQMHAQARQAWDNALATAQATLDQTNKAVSNRNEAVLQDFMNSIPKEQWGTEESNQHIDNAFSKMAELTGNMYDAKVMNAYRDNRGQVLLEQDNAKLANKEITQKWQQQYDDQITTQIAREAPLIQAILNDPSKADTPAYEEALVANDKIAEMLGANPYYASMVKDKITAHKTEQATAEEKLAQAQLLPDLPSINVLLSDLAQYEPLTRQPMPDGLSEDEQVVWQADQATVIAKMTQIKGELEPYVTKHGRGRINALYQDHISQAQDTQDKRFGTPFEQGKLKIQKLVEEGKLTIAQAKLLLQGKMTDAQIDKIVADIQNDNQRTDNDTYRTLYGGNDSGSGGNSSSKEPARKVASDFFKTDPVTADGKIKPQMSSVIFGTLNNIPDLIESGREKDFYVSSDDYDKFKLESLSKLKTMYGDSGWFKTEYGFHTLAGHLNKYIKPAYTDTKRNVTVSARPLTNWEKKQILMSTATGNIKGWWLTNDSNYVNHITKELATLEEKKYRATNDKQQAYLNNALQNLIAIGFDYGQIAVQMNLTSKDAYYDKYPKGLKDSIRAKESVENSNTPTSPKGVLQSNIPHNQSVGALTGLIMPTAFKNPPKPKEKDNKRSGGRVPVN